MVLLKSAIVWYLAVTERKNWRAAIQRSMCNLARGMFVVRSGISILKPLKKALALDFPFLDKLAQTTTQLWILKVPLISFHLHLYMVESAMTEMEPLIPHEDHKWLYKAVKVGNTEIKVFLGKKFEGSKG